MGELIIRDLDDKVLVQLKRRAWMQGLSLQESLRRLIIDSVERDDPHEADVIVMPSLGRLHDSRNERIARRAALHS